MQSEIRPKIVAIDVDGTIVKNKWPEIGPLKKGAKKYINKLVEDGYIIIIWTCRCRQQEQDVINFLTEKDIKFHYINMHPPWLTEKMGNDTRKIFADVYIDDKQLGGLPSWEKIYKMVKKM